MTALAVMWRCEAGGANGGWVWRFAAGAVGEKMAICQFIATAKLPGFAISLMDLPS
jgi:hypothetical protein